MKLAIIVNRQFLVIPDDVAVNLEQPSPLFEYEGVPGKWLLPITIPYLENAAILGMPNEPTVIDEPIEYECQFLIENTWLLKGSLLITQCDEQSIEISGTCPYYDMSEELFNTNIRDLDWDDILLVEPEPQIYIDIVFSLIGAPGADTITLNTSFAEYEYVATGFEGTVGILGALQDAVNLDTDESGISATIIGSDTLRLRQDALGTHNNVFDTSLISVTSATYTVTYDFMTWLTDWHDDCAAALDDYAESGEIYPDRLICFPNVMNKNHFGDLIPEFTGWINYYHINQYFINYTSAQAFAGNKYAVMPFVFALTVLDKIFDACGISITGPLVTEERFQRIIIDNNFSLGKEWYDPVSEDTILVVNDRISIANHLPSMTVGEFLTGYRNKFNAYFAPDPDLRTMSIKLKEDVITDQVRNDWSEKEYMPNPTSEFKLIDGVTLTSPGDESDEYSGSYPVPYNEDLPQNSDYVIGNGKTIISSVFGCPSVYKVEVISGLSPKAKAPYKFQFGSGNEFEQRLNEFSPGLLIYKGIAQDENGEDYVYATNDHLNENDEDDSSNISLQWDKLYELFFAKWLDFELNSAQIRIGFNLPVADLMGFKFDEFYGFKHKDWIAGKWEISDVENGKALVEFIFYRRKNYLN